MTASEPFATPAIHPRRLALVPFVLAVAFLIEQLDATVIVTALPAMARSLHTTPLRLNLAITGYVLSLALFIPLSGWTADRFGARRVFVLALLAFTLASMACGAATSLPMLVGLRIVQGIGGAMMTPVGRLILLRSFPKERLAVAMSQMTVPVLIGPALGPLLGGVLTTYANWRWIFYINVPIGLIGAACALRILPEIPPQPGQRFDGRGFALCAGGIALVQILVETLDWPGIGWGTDAGILLAASVLLLLYGQHARRTPHAALDLSLFRIRAFRIGVVAGGFNRIGLNACPFLLPLMLQLAFGYSAIQSGLITFLAAIGAILTKTVTSRLLRSLGFDRLLLGNALLATLAIGGFAFAYRGVPVWVAVPYVLVFGMIRSVQFSSSNALTFSEVPRARLGPCVSLAGVAQQLGMSFGVSLSALMLGRLALHHVSQLDAFRIAFLLMALFPLVSVLGFLRLRAEDGAAVSHHQRGQPA